MDAKVTIVDKEAELCTEDGRATQDCWTVLQSLEGNSFLVNFHHLWLKSIHRS